MRFGFALPHYDYSVAGESPLRWETVAEYARTAERAGFDSLWLSDHLFLDLGKYGGSSERVQAFDPLVTLAALSRVTTRPRLGTLVLCEALRPASVLAKALATLDVICDGRLDVGIGAGWYEPDYEAIGMTMPSPGVRIARLREAVEVLEGLLGGGPSTVDGEYHRAFGAWNRPAARQHPRPRIVVGGKGDHLLGLAAERADEWNTCWVWEPDDYRGRVAVLERACDRIGRDPATVGRSLGLYALVGEDQHDLERRWARLQATTPKGVLDGTTPDGWRRGRLVGTVAEVAEQVAGWAALGVDLLIVGAGAVPFAVTAPDDVEMLGHVLRSTG